MNNKYIDKTLEISAILSFVALILVVFIQVFSRFLLPSSPSWTEEASRFIFIYAIAFSAPLALKRNEYVRVDILLNKFSEKIQNIIEYTICCVIVIFFIGIAYYGIEFASYGKNQTSPALGLEMIIPYSALAYSSIFVAYYSIERIINKRRGVE